MVTVPALAVGHGDAAREGALNYFVLQMETDPDRKGPTVVFNELPTLWSGSAVGDTLKEGVRQAVLAAAHALGADERGWHITIKNFSRSRFSDGSSASSAVAVGIMAAIRGDQIAPDVALTGVVAPSGIIRQVGGLPQKLEAAAEARMHTLLVPRGQAQTTEWDLLALGQLRGVAVIEIETLADAYAYMTRRAL